MSLLTYYVSTVWLLTGSEQEVHRNPTDLIVEGRLLRLAPGDDALSTNLLNQQPALYMVVAHDGQWRR